MNNPGIGDEKGILIGVDLNDDYTQVAYWNYENRRPEIIRVTEDPNSSFIPSVLIFEENTGRWRAGFEAIENYNSNKQVLIENFLNNIPNKYLTKNKELANENLVAIYLREILNIVINKLNNKNIEAIIFSLGNLNLELIENIQDSIKLLGLDNVKIDIQRHDESFIYFNLNYDLNQSKIGMFDISKSYFKYYQIAIRNEFESYDINIVDKDFSEELTGEKIDQVVKEYIKEIYKETVSKVILDENDEIIIEQFFYKNRSYIYAMFFENKPADLEFTVGYSNIAVTLTFNEFYQYISEYDNKFYDLTQLLLSKNMVPYIYLSGNSFTVPWATKGIQSMCSGRNVFQSLKIFSRGACYFLAYKYGLIKLPEITINSSSIIQNDYGLMINIKGQQGFVPLLPSGTYWYKAKNKIKTVIDDSDKISVFKKSGGSKITEVGRIDISDKPQRPPKATKFDICMKYISPNEFQVEINDLGFGKLFEKTDKKWVKNFQAID